MSISNSIQSKKLRRQARVRSRIFGTAESPRLSVFRSNKFFYGQLINDEAGKTLAAVSTKKISDGKSGNKTNAAAAAGKLLAELAKKAGIKRAIFDRGSYQYHGRVKAFAEAVRAAGLKI